MKRIISVLLLLTLALTFVSCKNKQDDIETPVLFYYCTQSAHKDSKMPVFEAEIRDATSFDGDLLSILNLYFKGPATDELATPFPSGTHVLSVIREDTDIVLTISSSFGELTGLDLSIACAAVSMTIIELTQCESVIICAQDMLLDGAEQIVISANMLYMDDIIPTS